MSSDQTDQSVDQQTSDQRSSMGQHGLEARYVTSRELFEMELSQVFGRKWICVGLVNQLHDRDFMAKSITGRSLILTMDEAGSVSCFYNVCRHRGAKLVDDDQTSTSQTRGVGDIVCPYHAWRYGLDGKLKTAANMNDVPGFDKKKCGLQPIACHVWNQLIWICFQQQPSAFEDFIVELDSLVQPWFQQPLQVHCTLQYTVNANWKLLFQNYSECYHCPTVHPALNRLTPFKNASNDLVEGPILGGPMVLGNDSRSMTRNGEFADKVLPGLDSVQERSVVYYTIEPSLFMSLHPDYVLLHKIEPIDQRTTVVECDFLFQSATTDPIHAKRQSAVEFWDETNRQDWQVCELVQKGMENPGYVPGPYSNLESLVAAFDRHYLKQINR